MRKAIEKKIIELPRGDFMVSLKVEKNLSIIVIVGEKGFDPRACNPLPEAPRETPRLIADTQPSICLVIFITVTCERKSQESISILTSFNEFHAGFARKTSGKWVHAVGSVSRIASASQPPKDSTGCG